MNDKEGKTGFGSYLVIVSMIECVSFAGVVVLMIVVFVATVVVGNLVIVVCSYSQQLTRMGKIGRDLLQSCERSDKMPFESLPRLTWFYLGNTKDLCCVTLRLLVCDFGS